MGEGRRAWQYHKNGNRPAYCQYIRMTNKDIKIKIVRDKLTKEGAMLVESCIKNFIELCGCILTNQTETLKRQEKPPLEI